MFAIDGTRVEVPKTAANERYFSKAHQEANSRLQAWLTVLWHLGLGLPWSFRHGPGFSGEREHLVEMLPDLPAGSMIAADAGFTCYALWQSLLEHGHSFLIRVGSNVRLLEAEGKLRRRGDISTAEACATYRSHWRRSSRGRSGCSPAWPRSPTTATAAEAKRAATIPLRNGNQPQPAAAPHDERTGTHHLCETAA